MRLYFNPFTRATRPRWLIEEAGLPVEIVRVDLAAGEQRTMTPVPSRSRPSRATRSSRTTARAAVGGR